MAFDLNSLGNIFGGGEQGRDIHQRMSQLDPRDTNGDGVVSPEEAAAYVQAYLQNATPEERSRVLGDYFQNMPVDQRQEMGNVLTQYPGSLVQSVNHQDAGALANAYQQAAQPTTAGESPLQSMFSQGALSNPLVKAGLIGLAGAIGSSLLRRS